MSLFLGVGTKKATDWNPYCPNSMDAFRADMGGCRVGKKIAAPTRSSLHFPTPTYPPPTILVYSLFNSSRMFIFGGNNRTRAAVASNFGVTARPRNRSYRGRNGSATNNIIMASGRWCYGGRDNETTQW
ncbi:DUF2946 domain-containing protein [Sesbania bispinosa]|nr:DUF2946 domain-containing protein [Sesbania bispinosa]